MKTDSHSHLFDFLADKSNEECLSIIDNLCFDRIILMTTSQSDWPRLLDIIKFCLGKTTKKLIPAIGLHPWKIQRNQGVYSKLEIDAILMTVENYLLEAPEAIVGEIGLDRFERILNAESTSGPCPDLENILELTKDYEMDIPLQFYIFQQFFNLAARLRRPVSLHAVKADTLYLDHFSRLLKSLNFSMDGENAILPPSILLHSYSGSKETLGRYIQLFEKKPINIFVSFSRVIHGRLPEEKMKRLIKEAGKERILLETDLDNPTDMPADYDWTLNIYCQVFGLAKEEAELILENNCKKYLRK